MGWMWVGRKLIGVGCKAVGIMIRDSRLLVVVSNNLLVTLVTQKIVVDWPL